MMARLNTREPSSESGAVGASSSIRNRSRSSSATPPSVIDSSDKENRSRLPKPRQHLGKRNSDTAPMSSREGSPAESSNKRKKPNERARGQPSQAAYRKELQDRIDTTYYDPDQDKETQRKTKKSLRDLVSKVNDSRAEFLQPGSKGIEKTLAEADQIYKNVKQTSVATIDSRLLVTVGDLAYKKVNTLTLGDSSTGVDVDDFVSKCIAFMRRGDDAQGQHSVSQRPSTQTSRRRAADVDGEDEDDDTGPMNWDYLGRNACFLYNSRPSLPNFLLGPLSVQKKVRQQSQRKAKEARLDPALAVRPLQLGQEDLEKQESANLTVICSEIARLLSKTIEKGEQNIEEEYQNLPEDLTDDQIRQLMTKHGLTDNGCVPLFNFCVNPNSFGQTVENMFYVSFLIKEGKVGLDFDSNDLPTLGTAQQKTVAERQETQRNQAVFTLDYDIWREIVESFGITRSIIPHRVEERWDDGTLEHVRDVVRDGGSGGRGGRIADFDDSDED